VRLVLGVLVVAVVVGLISGGRIGRIASLRIRYPALAIVGLGLQFFFPARGAWPYVFLLASFLLLATFAIVNVKVAGFTLILVGMLMNFLVIAVNHGMPVTQRALVDSGQSATLTELVAHGGEKHHLAGPGDHLLFLGDVIAVPPPIHQAASAGDVVSYFGVAWVVVAAMRRPDDAELLTDVPRLEDVPDV
jgi:Family of unknown function (DUF5317)